MAGASSGRLTCPRAGTQPVRAPRAVTVRPASIVVAAGAEWRWPPGPTLFLTALDERVRFGCASGALASYRRKMADGTGIEMAEVIPGFSTRFDLEHVLAAIAPRAFLVVSGTEDRYSADADELIDLARPAFRTAARSLTHRRAEGGHALDRERFEPIIDWIIEHAATSR